jgi:hypothetical protein
MHQRIKRVASTTAAALLLWSTITFAAVVGGPVGKIQTLWTYSDFGTGDVVFTPQSPLSSCPNGFWIRMTDAVAKSVYAQVLAAYHAQTVLVVYAYDDSIWSGSSGIFCRVHGVGQTAS